MESKKSKHAAQDSDSKKAAVSLKEAENGESVAKVSLKSESGGRRKVYGSKALEDEAIASQTTTGEDQE